MIQAGGGPKSQHENSDRSILSRCWVTSTPFFYTAAERSQGKDDELMKRTRQAISLSCQIKRMSHLQADEVKPAEPATLETSAQNLTLTPEERKLRDSRWEGSQSWSSELRSFQLFPQHVVHVVCCSYVCVYIYTCVYIYIYIYTHICITTHIIIYYMIVH